MVTFIKVHFIDGGFLEGRFFHLNTQSWRDFVDSHSVSCTLASDDSFPASGENNLFILKANGRFRCFGCCLESIMNIINKEAIKLSEHSKYLSIHTCEGKHCSCFSFDCTSVPFSEKKKWSLLTFGGIPVGAFLEELK